ncbi:MAG: hypothetical protein B6U76_01485 [Desulfurococcales archaeon ex4484_217_2]|nr:MAG: hypothetical protein B6U76_01485 [Desulfurococcales archaeon ex4484_217_2]
MLIAVAVLLQLGYVRASSEGYVLVDFPPEAMNNSWALGYVAVAPIVPSENITITVYRFRNIILHKAWTNVSEAIHAVVPFRMEYSVERFKIVVERTFTIANTTVTITAIREAETHATSSPVVYILPSQGYVLKEASFTAYLVVSTAEDLVMNGKIVFSGATGSLEEFFNQPLDGEGKNVFKTIVKPTASQVTINPVIVLRKMGTAETITHKAFNSKIQCYTPVFQAQALEEAVAIRVNNYATATFQITTHNVTRFFIRDIVKNYVLTINGSGNILVTASFPTLSGSKLFSFTSNFFPPEKQVKAAFTPNETRVHYKMPGESILTITATNVVPYKIVLQACGEEKVVFNYPASGWLQYQSSLLMSKQITEQYILHNFTLCNVDFTYLTHAISESTSTFMFKATIPENETLYVEALIYGFTRDGKQVVFRTNCTVTSMPASKPNVVLAYALIVAGIGLAVFTFNIRYLYLREPLSINWANLVKTIALAMGTVAIIAYSDRIWDSLGLNSIYSYTISELNAKLNLALQAYSSLLTYGARLQGAGNIVSMAGLNLKKAGFGISGLGVELLGSTFEFLGRVILSLTENFLYGLFTVAYALNYAVVMLLHIMFFESETWFAIAFVGLALSTISFTRRCGSAVFSFFITLQYVFPLLLYLPLKFLSSLGFGSEDLYYYYTPLGFAGTNPAEIVSSMTPLALVGYAPQVGSVATNLLRVLTYTLFVDAFLIALAILLIMPLINALSQYISGSSTRLAYSLFTILEYR